MVTTTAEKIGNVARVLGGRAVLGAEVRSNLDMHRLIEAGFPFRVLEAVARASRLSISALADSVGIPRTTLARRKHAHRLTPEESERTYRLGRVFSLARIAFDSPEAAAEWFQNPNRALGGEIPLKMLRSEAGAREAEAVLGRIVYGGYS